MAIFQDGKPVYMLHRYQIESSQAPEIAETLTAAFDKYCTKTPVTAR
jgi:putative YphP/YqiW family bacilliredoxin